MVHSDHLSLSLIKWALEDAELLLREETVRPPGLLFWGRMSVRAEAQLKKRRLLMFCIGGFASGVLLLPFGSLPLPLLNQPVRCCQNAMQAYLAGLPLSRHSATSSETFASPMHMTVSAPPQ